MANPAKDMAEAVLAGGGFSARKLGLRFDRVAVRVLGDLQTFADVAVPDGSAVVVTISAPIRLPAKTVDVMRAKIASASDHSGDIHGNRVSLRRLQNLAGQRPKLVGFVHSCGADPGRLLDLAERWLRHP